MNAQIGILRSLSFETTVYDAPRNDLLEGGRYSLVPLLFGFQRRWQKSKTVAVEMTLLRKSQNDSHRSLQISLENTRFAHFHKPIPLSSSGKNVE